ncbi:MAG: condensation domain-containing protein, partial [Synergistaceae bacterium]|nr:condensation domain-containing protein [Synergistaceae bacterium]
MTNLEKAPARETWPLTFAERQMAIEQHMNPQSNAYNNNEALEIGGALDTAGLERALGTLVSRHAAFRSYYPMENGEFVRRVAEADKT